MPVLAKQGTPLYDWVETLITQLKISLKLTFCCQPQLLASLPNDSDRTACPRSAMSWLPRHQVPSGGSVCTGRGRWHGHKGWVCRRQARWRSAILSAGLALRQGPCTPSCSSAMRTSGQTEAPCSNLRFLWQTQVWYWFLPSGHHSCCLMQLLGPRALKESFFLKVPLVISNTGTASLDQATHQQWKLGWQCV